MVDKALSTCPLGTVHYDIIKINMTTNYDIVYLWYYATE